METKYKKSKQKNKQANTRRRITTVQEGNGIFTIPPWPTKSHPHVLDARRVKLPEPDNQISKYSKRMTEIELEKKKHKNTIEIQRKLELITRRVLHTLEAGGFEPDLPEANLEDLDFLPMKCFATSFHDNGLERKRYFKDLLNTITETSILRDGLLQEALMWLNSSALSKKNLESMIKESPNLDKLENSGETILEALSRTNMAIQQLSLLTVKIIGFDNNEESLHTSMLDAFRLCSNETRKRVRQAMKIAESREARTIEHDMVEFLQMDCEDEKMCRNILQEISDNSDQLKDICNTIQGLWVAMTDNPVISNTRKKTLKRSIFLFNLVVMILTKRNRDLLVYKAEIKQRELDIHSTQSQISRLSSDLVGFHERYDELYRNTASSQLESLVDGDGKFKKITEGSNSQRAQVERNMYYRMKKALVNKELQGERLERYTEKLRKSLKFEDYYDSKDSVYSGSSLNISTSEIMGIKVVGEDAPHPGRARYLAPPSPRDGEIRQRKGISKNSSRSSIHKPSKEVVAAEGKHLPLEGASDNKTGTAAPPRSKAEYRNIEIQKRMQAYKRSVSIKLVKQNKLAQKEAARAAKRNSLAEQIEALESKFNVQESKSKSHIQESNEVSASEEARSADRPTIKISYESSNSEQEDIRGTQQQNREFQESLQKLKSQSKQTERIVTDFKDDLAKILEKAGFKEQSQMLSEIPLGDGSSQTEVIHGENIDLLSSMREQNIRLRGTLDAFLVSIKSSIQSNETMKTRRSRMLNVQVQTSQLTASTSITDTMQQNVKLQKQLKIFRKALQQINHEKQSLQLSKPIMHNLIERNPAKYRATEQSSSIEPGDGYRPNSQIELSKYSEIELLSAGESVTSSKTKLNQTFSSDQVDPIRFNQAWIAHSSSTLLTNEMPADMQPKELSQVKLFRCISENLVQLQENLSDRTLPVFGFDKTLFEDTMDVRKQYESLMEEALQDLCKRFVPLMRLKSLTRTTGNIIVKYRDLLSNMDHNDDQSALKIERKLSRAESTYWKIQKRRDQLVNNASNSKESKNKRWTSLLELRKQMIQNYQELQTQVQHRIFKGREIDNDDIKRLPPLISEMMFLCKKITADMLDEKVDGHEDIQIEDEEDSYLSSDDFTNEEQHDPKPETTQKQSGTSEESSYAVAEFSKVTDAPLKPVTIRPSASMPVIRDYSVPQIRKSKSSTVTSAHVIKAEKHGKVGDIKVKSLTSAVPKQRSSRKTKPKFEDNMLEYEHRRSKSALAQLEFVEPVTEESESPFRKNLLRPKTARAHSKASINSYKRAAQLQNGWSGRQRIMAKSESPDQTWRKFKSCASYEELPWLDIRASDVLGDVNISVWAQANLDAKEVRKRLQHQLKVNQPQLGRPYSHELKRLRELAWVESPKIIAPTTLSKQIKK